MEVLALEEDVGDDGKDAKADTLLDHFELHQVEWAAVANVSDAVGGHLTAIFEEGNGPGKGDDPEERPVGARPGLL